MRGEYSTRRKFRAAKFPAVKILQSKNNARQAFCAAKIPVAKFMTAKIPPAKLPVKVESLQIKNWITQFCRIARKIILPYYIPMDHCPKLVILPKLLHIQIQCCRKHVCNIPERLYIKYTARFIDTFFQWKLWFSKPQRMLFTQVDLKNWWMR